MVQNPDVVGQNFFNIVGNLYGLSGQAGMYFFVLLISIAVAVAVASRTKKPLTGVYGFFGMLAIFAVFGAFPLWIVILPLLVVIILGGKYGS